MSLQLQVLILRLALYALTFFGGCRVCVWSAALIIILAILGACSFINRFTRVAGELFGILIAVLFVQQAVKVATSYFM